MVKWEEFMSQDNQTKDSSLRLTILYCLVGIIWIMLSDKLIEFFVHNEEMISFINIIKGSAYVVISAGFFYFFCSRLYKKIRDLEITYSCSDFKLSLADKELELIRELFDSLIDDKMLLQEKCQSYEQELKFIEDVYKVILETTGEIIWDETNGRMYFSNFVFDCRI